MQTSFFSPFSRLHLIGIFGIEMTTRPLPKGIELVKSYEGNRREVSGWNGRIQDSARVRVQMFWRCTTCGEYFDNLGEAKEHKIGKSC